MEPHNKSSICQEGSAFHQLVSSRAQNKRIIVSFTNFGFVDLADNLIACFGKLNITNYIMVALDAKAYDYLHAQGHPTHLVEVEKKLFDESTQNFGTMGFIDICNLKPWLVLELLKAGFDVVWTDTDIVWLQDAQKYFDLNSWVDMQIQSDDDDICAGYFFIRSNPRTCRFLQLVLDYVSPAVDDQVGLRRYLQNDAHSIRITNRDRDHELRMKPSATRWYLQYMKNFSEKEAIFNRDEGSFKEISEAPADLGDRITYLVLDRVMFPNGSAYFNAKLPQKLGVQPIIVHNNCIIGHDPKKIRFQMYNLWFASEKGRKVDGRTNMPVPAECAAPEFTLKGFLEIASAVDVDENYLYAASYDKSVWIWNRQTKKLAKMMHPNKRGGIWALKVQAAQGRAFTGGHDKFLQMWNISTPGSGIENTNWTSVQIYKGHHGIINSLLLYKDMLFSGSDDMTARAWNIATGEKIHMFRGASGPITGLAADSGAIFASSEDGSVRAWDVHSGKVLQVYTGHVGSVNAVAVNGFTLFSAGNDAIIREWDVRNGDCLREYEGHERSITSLQLSPDGNTLVSGSVDGTVRLWDVGNDQQQQQLQQKCCKKVFRAHTAAISCMSLIGSPAQGEATLYTGSFDKSFREWKV